MKSLYNIKVKNSDKRKGNLLCYEEDGIYRNYYTADIESFEEDEIRFIDKKEDYIVIDAVPSLEDDEILLSICQRVEDGGYIDTMESIKLNKTKMTIMYMCRGELTTLRNAKVRSITKYNNDFNTYLEIDHVNSKQPGSVKINIWDILNITIKS